MIDLQQKEIIIWDWNGTLLNDAQFCVDCMNVVLLAHEIKSIDLNLYRKHFTFPVKDYYEAIGFDFDVVDFKIPAMEFINEYYSNISRANLHVDAVKTLSSLKKKGKLQYVLSAMEHGELIKSLTSKGIIDFFKDIQGIEDHYAHSKVEMGKKLMKKLNCELSKILMIGDTIHDFEVVNQLGIDCILVSNGHQSVERLKSVTDNIVDHLGQLTNFFG